MRPPPNKYTCVRCAGTGEEPEARPVRDLPRRAPPGGAIMVVMVLSLIFWVSIAVVWAVSVLGAEPETPPSTQDLM